MSFYIYLYEDSMNDFKYKQKYAPSWKLQILRIVFIDIAHREQQGIVQEKQNFAMLHIHHVSVFSNDTKILKYNKEILENMYIYVMK